MKAVGIFEMKTNLSKYVSAIAEREIPSIVIEKNGKPVARLIPYDAEYSNRIGIARGVLPIMPELDEFNSIDVSDAFYGNGGLL